VQVGKSNIFGYAGTKETSFASLVGADTESIRESDRNTFGRILIVTDVIEHTIHGNGLTNESHCPGTEFMKRVKSNCLDASKEVEGLVMHGCIRQEIVESCMVLERALVRKGLEYVG